MFHRFRIVPLVVSLLFQPAVGRAQDIARPPAQVSLKDETKELLTDAAIVAIIIGASIAAYKAMGKPCACPSDTARNGSSCGGRSAWSKPGGFKPLCFVTDINPSMIAGYRATKAIPPLQ